MGVVQHLQVRGVADGSQYGLRAGPEEDQGQHPQSRTHIHEVRTSLLSGWSLIPIAWARPREPQDGWLTPDPGAGGLRQFQAHVPQTCHVLRVAGRFHERPEPAGTGCYKGYKPSALRRIFSQVSHASGRELTVSTSSMTAAYIDTQPHLLDKWASLNPMGRIGRPDELRGVVTWLASDASTFCTGSEYVSRPCRK